MWGGRPYDLGMGLRITVAQQLVPRIQELTPGLTSGFVREALNRAIDGIGPLAPAAEAADKQLAEQKGDVDRAIHEVIENNVRIAGAQGFATNLGGLITMAVAIPANISGLAIIQCRMVAGIAHLRGHDLSDPRVRNAVMALLLGEDQLAELVRLKKLPTTPMALATAPAHDPTLDALISGVVATDMITRIAGKRVATTVGRRIPVVGGVIGAGTDGFSTWKIGRYADRELLPRRRT